MHIIRSSEILVLQLSKPSFSSNMSVPIKVTLFEEAFGDYLEK